MEEVQCNCGLEQNKMPGIKLLSRFVRTRTVSVIMVLLLCIVHTDSVKDPTSNERLKKFSPNWDIGSTRIYRGPDEDAQYFRKFVLHENMLYVGAKNRLYRFDTIGEFENPKRSADLSGGLVATQIRNCDRTHTNTKLNCANHIRTIWFHEDRILVCGTGAFKPITSNLVKSNLSLVPNNEHNIDDSGLALCPYDPQDNATWVWVGASSNPADGNPYNEGQIYSATVIDEAKTDPLIYRPEINTPSGQTVPLVRTMQQDHYWLNDAQFVGSFSVGQYVYFFFREPALESGKTVFSRVARICKKDTGGRGILENVWTTFLKARLICSVDDDTPYYFNEIYDIVKLDDETFIGTFTTNFKKGFYGSATCAFKRQDIDDAFNHGSFKNPENHWKPISNGEIPSPRPGMCNNSTLRNEVLPFIKAHPLMDRDILQHLSMPIFSSMDVLFSKMAIHETLGKNDQKYTVLYMATDKGDIYKVLYGIVDGKYQSELLAVMDLEGNKSSNSVWAMTVHGEHLYSGTDRSVSKVDVHQCDVYTQCTTCAADPHCGWNTQKHKCQAYSHTFGLIQDVFGDTLKSCSCLMKQEAKPVRMKGDPIMLDCASYCEPKGDVVWYKNNQQINLEDSKIYFLTTTNNLVILNNTDSATYTCKSDDVELAIHSVKVPACDQPDCIWREEFNNWCSAFDDYRKEFDKWKNRQSVKK